KANRVPQRADVVGKIDNRTVHAVLDDFTETIVVCCDDGQPASQRFQTSVRERIVNARQNEDIGGGVNRAELGKLAEKADRLFREKPFRFVTASISAASHQQSQFAIATKLERFDREAQTFPFPTGAHEKQYGLIRLQLQF